MFTEMYECDACGIQRRDQKGWLIMTFEANNGSVIHIQKAEKITASTRRGNDLDICGAACAQKKLSELLPRLS